MTAQARSQSDEEVIDHVASASGYLSEAGSPLRRPAQFWRETRNAFLISCRIAPRLTARSLRAQYRSSVLGYVWLFLPPLAISFTWLYLTWSGVISNSETRLPYSVFVVTGILLWTSFFEAVSSPLNQLLEAANLLSKVNFPPEAVIVSGFLSVLLSSVVRLVILIPVFLLGDVRPSASLLLAPIGLLALLILGFSVGLILAPFGALYRDFGQAIPIALYFLFFLTPVAYEFPDTLDEPLLVRYNPISSVLDTARDWLTGGPAMPSPTWLIMVFASMLLLVFGWVVFRVAMPHLVDRINV